MILQQQQQQKCHILNDTQTQSHLFLRNKFFLNSNKIHCFLYFKFFILKAKNYLHDNDILN